MRHDNPMWILVMLAAILFGVTPIVCYYAYASAPSIPNFNVGFVVWTGTVGWLSIGTYSVIMINRRDTPLAKKSNLRVLPFRKKGD